MKKILLMLSILLLASCGNNSHTQSGSTVTSATGTTATTSNEMMTTDMNTEDKAPIGKTADGAITYGNGAARIQVFADFQCPACQSADKIIFPVLDELAEAEKITIEYRQFPLVQVHPNAFADANAALCAADQNQYRQYKKHLYALEEKKKGTSISHDEYIAIAKNLQMNEELFANCVKNQNYKSQVEADMALGKSLGVTGTPTFLLDGKPLSMEPFHPADNNPATLQNNLKTFLEKYVSQHSPNAQTEVTTDETMTMDDGIGGVVETDN